MESGKSPRPWIGFLSLSVLLLTVCVPGHGTDDNGSPLPEPPPTWAFAVNPPAEAPVTPAPAVNNAPHRVPGSAAAFTLAQTKDYFNPPDWHPERHSAMPAIVAQGRPPEVIACGYCHLPNGQGRPENSSLAGLPADYIVQQVADFRTGRRRSSAPEHLPTATMISRETKADVGEVEAAAQYFSGLKPKPWIRVVETGTVPVMQVAGWMFVPSDPPRKEPLGQRIVETAEDLERTELRDDASGFIAFVPRGSVRKGAELVKSGGAGGTMKCADCHGPDLKGLGPVPPLAGRSPSYVVRQLYDFQHGARVGAGAELMAPVVAKLTVSDMLAIAAYTASLRP